MGAPLATEPAAARRAGACRAFGFVRNVRGEAGQASVEAAALLPALLLLVGLLVQPLCLFYARATMAGAAAEGARVLATKTGAVEDAAVQDYVKRRLAAVPDVSIFHEGGPDSWEVVCQGGEGDKEVLVTVKGSARPLPLLGALAAPFCGPGGVVRLEVTARETVRPAWLGGDYGSWTSVWG